MNMTNRGMLPGAVRAQIERAAPTPQSAFMQRMRSGVGPLGVTVLGDSTTDDWLNLWVASLAAAFPAWTVLRHRWNDPAQGYLAPTHVQTGASAPYLSYAAANSSASTPASARVNVVNSDLMIRCKFRKTALSGADASIVAQYGLSGNRAYTLYVKANGDLALGYTANGSSYVEMIILTAAEMAANFTAGADGYVGVTLTRNNGANAVGQGIRSTDGTTWSTVGTAKTSASIAGLFDSTYQVEVGCRNTLLPWDGRIYWVEVYKGAESSSPLAFRFDPAWHIHGGSGTSFKDAMGVPWALANLASVTHGPPTLTVMDGSVSGTTISYADDATRRPLLASCPANLIVGCFGHNEAPADGNVASSYKTLIDNVTALAPGAGVVLCRQAPQATGEGNYARQNNHQHRIAELASRYGWGVIDAWTAFVATGDPDALISDGVHPTSAGYALWADEARRSFGF